MLRDHLGKFGTDKVTGFKGTVVGCLEYMSGCSQLFLVPRVGDDGKMIDGQWFDLQRVVVDVAKGKVAINNGETPGSDHTPKPQRF